MMRLFVGVYNFCKRHGTLKTTPAIAANLMNQVWGLREVLERTGPKNHSTNHSKMKPSPLGSKLLSAYAVLFAGLAPAGIAIVGLIHGIGLPLLYNAVLGAAIVYFGIRVFLGDYSAVRIFAILVIIHYLGIIATNLWNSGNFPDESRAAQMAVPRMIRGVLFAGVFSWYFLFRRKTVVGFRDDSPLPSLPN
jgi:hypothetical protein